MKRSPFGKIHFLLFIIDMLHLKLDALNTVQNHLGLLKKFKILYSYVINYLQPETLQNLGFKETK